MELKSGGQCNYCFSGRWQTYAVLDEGQMHSRYLKCDACKRCAPTKQIIRASDVKRRVRKTLSNKTR